MKHFKFTFVLTILLSIVELQAYADWDRSTRIEVDGLYYFLDNDNNQAIVVSMPSGKYTGNIIIPSSFTYNTNNYSVTSIEDLAFAECSGLTSITIPNSVTIIKHWAFYCCSGLTSITIPNSVTSIDNQAFYNCSGLTSITVGSGNTKYDSRNNCNAIIEKASNMLMTGCKNTVIPNSVTSIGAFAFDGCSDLSSITIPNSVTSIGDYAFSRCSGLTSITIPNSVTGIGNSAFGGCSRLTSITIPNSVTGIGDYAFVNCTGLTSITIPNSVTGIGEGAFYGCSGLTSITTSNSMTSIGNSAFYGCSGLTSITIPNSVTSIGKYAFYECSGLTSVVIPNSVTSIGDNAFCYCSGLTSVTISNSVTSIGNSAFTFCSGLTSITIPNSVTSIGSQAFTFCSGLTSVSISNSVTSIGELAFCYCSGLTSITIPNSVTSIGISAFNGCSGMTSVTIPNSVTVIGNSAFAGCGALTSVTVDIKTPLAITNYTFSNRTNATLYVPIGSKAAYEAADYWKEFKTIKENAGVVTTATINVETAGTLSTLISDANKNTISTLTLTGSLNGDDFRFIREMAGSDYNANPTNGSLSTLDLSGATIVDGGSYLEIQNRLITYSNGNSTGHENGEKISQANVIGEYLFAGCEKLQTIVLPDNLTAINDYAFHRSGLTTITIPEGVTTIGGSAFWGCTGLTTISIPSSVSTIGFGVFAECSSLNSVTIPNNVTSINKDSFWGCTNLSSIVIPSNVTSIGESAFYGCSNLSTIEIPNSVTSVGLEAFSGTAWLSNQPNGLLYVGKVLYAYIGKMPANTNISINEGTTSIAGKAFQYCNGLTSITIPNSVTSIGALAFQDCKNLSSIEIPNSVTSIGSYSFSGCSGLTSLTIPNSVTSIDLGMFSGCSGLTSVSIPNSWTGIPVEAFNFCSSLTTIEIPSSVTAIGIYAFAVCSSLTTVTVHNPTPAYLDIFSFSNRSGIDLIVPVGSISAYKAADYWKDFKTIKDTEGRTEDASEPSGIDVTDISQLDNAIYIDPTEGRVSEVVELPVQLKNTMSAVGCSFKLTLPEGFTLQKDVDGDVIYDLGDRAKKMSVTMNEMNNRTYDFALTPSTGTATISGNDGVVVTFKVVIPENATEGAHALHLTNNLIQSRVDGVTRDFLQSDITTVINVSNYVTGDVNSDGVVTPSDAIMILYHYFNVEQNGFNVKAADINGDGNISPADAIEALYIYFNIGSANTRSALVNDQLDLDPE